MNKMNTLFLSLILCTSITGCASFKGEMLSPVQQFPKPQGEKTSIAVNLKFQQMLNDKPISVMTESGRKALEKKCVKRFLRSGLFSAVGTDLQDANLIADISVIDDGQANMGMAFLTGLTLYIVPSSATDTYKLTANITDQKTGKIETIQLEDSVTQWQEILLLPLMPFKFTPVVAGGVQNTLFDNLALKIAESGILDCRPND